MRKLLILFLVLSGLHEIKAQVVVPNIYTSASGNATFLGPLANSARTYQMLINSNQLTSLVGKELTGISFRLTSAASAAWPAANVDFSSYSIYLGESVAPANRSLASFSSNEVGTPTLVRSGPLSIHAGDYGLGGPPKPFGSAIVFNTPWLYTGGHLMVKIVHTGFTGTSTSVDAASSSAPGSGTDFNACWQGTGGVTNGNFVVTSFSFQTPMPVKLVDFAGSKQQDNILLKWATATEVNTDRFVIERSADGKTFSDIGSVKAAGSAGGHIQYSYEDKKPVNASQVLFYRLRMIDRDGSFEISRIIKITVEGKNEMLSVYPNPAGSVSTIAIDATKKMRLSCSIIDMKGKQVRFRILDVDKGVNTFDINVADLAAGAYVIRITGELLDLQQRLIKQ